MYAVSNDYIKQITGQSARTNWYGTVESTSGIVYTFDSSNIMEGSGKITREICTGDDIEIGTTCSAELDIDLLLPNVDRYDLYGGTISLFFQLQLADDSWETVPVGVFTISDPPERSQNIVSISAYDAMLKFNKDFGATISGTPYYLLTYACSACNVELGTTQEEIANYANGTIETYTYAEAELYTYRDLVGYIASYMGCYACIGVDGKLYVQPYRMSAIRTIPSSWRYEYTPQDYEAYYTTLTSYFEVSQETESVSFGIGGLTYELGSNPLIQFNADSVRKSVLKNILTTISQISYTPFTASTPCDPSLTVGDVLNFTGNHAVDGKHSAITKQVITINGGMELTCVGSNPNLNVKTEKEKAIQTASKNSNKDGMYYYDYVNSESISIADGETAQVILFNYTTNKETHVDFHGQVKCSIETTETYDKSTDAYTEEDGVIYVIYKSGGAEVTEYYPIDTFFDGVHLLNLLWTWWASANIISDFEVLIRCEGCSIEIEQGSSRGYIAGVSLVGDNAWDGSVNIYESITPVDFSIIRKSFTSDVETTFQTPSMTTPNDSLKRLNFMSILKSFKDSVVEKMLHRFDVKYSRYLMSYDNVVVSDEAWVLDDPTKTGTITTPNCAVDRIIALTSAHSGNDVAYIVSFDGGSKWWTYNNGWAEPDYSKDIYGMFEGTMRSITASQWAEKLNGSIMVRAILVENSNVTDIQIYTEVHDA